MIITILVLLVTVVMFFLKWADVFSRSVMIYFVIINTLLTLTLHLGFKKVLRMNFASDKSIIKVMVITEKSLLKETVQRLKIQLELNYQIVAIGCLDGTPETADYEGIPIVPADHIIEHATVMALDEVFISAPGSSNAMVKKLLHSFGEMGVDCHYNLELPGICRSSACRRRKYAANSCNDAF